MNIPTSAFPQILKMVTQSLPYEMQFEPITPEARTTVSILTAITDKDQNLKEVNGFIYHMAKKIDKKPTTQASTRCLLLSLKDILETYMSDTTHEIE